MMMILRLIVLSNDYKRFMHACMIIQLFANNKFYSKILIEHNSGNCGKSKWEKKNILRKRGKELIWSKWEMS